MRIRIPLASSMALVIALALAPQAYGLPPGNYTVYYSCHVGPGGCGPGGDWYGCLVGEWSVGCNGQWYGWGMQPYTSCAEFVDVQSESCGPDQQEPLVQSVIPSGPAPELCGPATPG
jgi:hypothetical protein